MNSEDWHVFQNLGHQLCNIYIDIIRLITVYEGLYIKDKINHVYVLVGIRNLDRTPFLRLVLFRFTTDIERVVNITIR